MWRYVSLAMIACGGHAPSKDQAPFVAHGVVHPTHVDTSTPSKPGVSTTPTAPPVEQAPNPNRCDDLATSDLSIDGLLDDWHGSRVLARAGTPGDGSVALRCAWDGATLALVLDVQDDRLIRVKGGDEDRVSIAVSAGGKPVAVTVFPGNSMAAAKITKPARVEAADSLQPKGFSVEAAIPSGSIAGFSPATPTLELTATFYDSDAATGGETTPVAVTKSIELGDRKDLLDDFLAAVKLAKTDIKLDTLAELDPDRPGNERVVAGGTVIGVLTDQFAFVTLPVPASSDVQKVSLLPLGAKGLQVISALIRQTGNGGSRDLLMLWTVWSGQLHPLANIEVRKQLGVNVLEAAYKIVNGKKGPELVVEPKPAIGFSADTWNEEPAGDADSIVLPWDTTKSGIAYSLQGAEINRRDLPKKK